jgi:hypothetical protein
VRVVPIVAGRDKARAIARTVNRNTDAGKPASRSGVRDGTITVREGAAPSAENAMDGAVRVRTAGRADGDSSRTPAVVAAANVASGSAR